MANLKKYFIRTSTYTFITYIPTEASDNAFISQCQWSLTDINVILRVSGVYMWNFILLVTAYCIYKCISIYLSACICSAHNEFNVNMLKIIIK